MPTPTLNDLTAVNPVLQNMLVAYIQADTRFIARRVFPQVPVADTAPSGTFYKFDKKYFFLDDMEVRAYGGDFSSLNIGVSTDTYATLQYAADHAIADEKRAANQAPMSLERAGILRLAQANLIRHERDFASTAFTTGVWGTDKTVGSKWSVFASSDPVGDVLTGVNTIEDNTGQTVNTFAFGNIVKKALLNHPDIIDRLKNVVVANQDNIMNALAGVFGIQNVLVARASYNTANAGQTASISAIIDDDALLCAVSPGADMESATAGKCFTWQPGGGEGSMYSYRDDSKHADVMQLKTQFDYKVVASDTGYFFSDVTD